MRRSGIVKKEEYINFCTRQFDDELRTKVHLSLIKHSLLSFHISMASAVATESCQVCSGLTFQVGHLVNGVTSAGLVQ